MLACLACYNDRLASVLENAADLRLYLLEGDGAAPAGRLPLANRLPWELVELLESLDVDILVCGAVCRPTLRLLGRTGIEVRAWTRGEVDEVIAALFSGRLEELAMPGRRKKRRDAC